MAAIAPKQIINSLKSVVSSVYKEGADQILSWPQIDERGYMKFRFRGGAQVYDCEISPDGIISYIEAQRSDSILLGTYFGPIAQYIEDSEYATGLLEAEILRLDGKKCRIGKSCGSTCITVNAKCSQMLGLQQKRAVESIRNAVSDRAKKGSNNNVAPLVAAGVGAGLVGAGLIAAGAIALSNKGSSGSSSDRETPTSSTPAPPPPSPPPPVPPKTETPANPPSSSNPPVPPEPEPEPPAPPPELSFSSEATTKINAGNKALAATFNFNEDGIGGGFSVKAKPSPDRGYEAALEEAKKSFLKESPKEIAAEMGVDLVNGGFLNPVGVVTKAIGKTIGKAGLSAAQKLKKPSAEEVTPHVDFENKTIHISQDSNRPDLDLVHGMGQYMHAIAQQDPQKAAKVNEFVNRLTTQSASCRRMQDKLTTAQKEKVIKDLEFELRSEQVFARAVTQYVAKKRGMEEHLRKLSLQASGGQQWNKVEFDRIEKDMDKLFNDLGWAK